VLIGKIGYSVFYWINCARFTRKINLNLYYKKIIKVKFLLLIVFRCVVLLEKFHSLHLGYLFNLLVSLIVYFKVGKKIHKHYAQYVFWA